PRSAAGRPSEAAGGARPRPRKAPAMTGDNRRLDLIFAARAAALLLLPWYRVRTGFFGLGWLAEMPGKRDLWPAVAQIVTGRWHLLPVLALVLLAAALRLLAPAGRRRGGWLALTGA